MHSWGPGVRPVYIIHYVTKGAGYLEYQHKKYRIEAGGSFCTAPDQVICYYPDTEEPWEYTWVDFVGKQVPAYLEQTCFSKSPVVEKKGFQEIGILFKQLLTLQIFHENMWEANGIFLTLLGKYRDAYMLGEERKGNRQKAENRRMDMALLLIQSNYHKEEFDVEKLCQHMNLSRATLFRLFDKNFSIAPGRFLLNYRLEQSKKLLERGGSVKETAISCGFADPFYFSRIFHEKYGVPPSGWQ